MRRRRSEPSARWRSAALQQRVGRAKPRPRAAAQPRSDRPRQDFDAHRGSRPPQRSSRRDKTQRRCRAVPDWIRVAKVGRNGVDGKSLTFRLAYEVGRTYQYFDVFEFGEEALFRRRDGAGLCPGAANQVPKNSTQPVLPTPRMRPAQRKQPRRQALSEALHVMCVESVRSPLKCLTRGHSHRHSPSAVV
jgi:hypothetical protein